MKLSYIILGLICLAGTLFHASFLGLNEVLKVADSFAYLQMTHYIQEFSTQGFGNGWFGFVYSLPIAIIDSLIGNEFFAAQITNIILINISACLLYAISQKFLPRSYVLFGVILFFLSPVILHFNIHILSENIYIPLFLSLFYITIQFLEERSVFSSPSILLKRQKKQVILLGIVIALMYLTRAEAFIYIGSIGLIAIALLLQKKLSFSHFLTLGTLFIISFIIFISPYLFHLHSLTGEWGLTNKGASNLRQAQLRGVEKMDDAGFEQAVAELTEDKHHLIAGFAGGMPYDAPNIEGSLREYISQDFPLFFERFLINQKKLYTKNIPELFLGDGIKNYFSDDPRFSNTAFLIFCMLPIFVLLVGIFNIYKKEKTLFFTTLSFFLPASIFFTLFFTLNRYFLIFLPLLLVFFVYGIYSIKYFKKLLSIVLVINILLLYSLGNLIYYNTEKTKDEYYALKKTAGEWLQNYCNQDVENRACSTDTLKIMERFPIVTYYSGSKTRYITPYTDNINDIYEYATYNDLDILVVDTMDFQTYRPGLAGYLEETPENFLKIQELTNQKGQKVILYGIKK